jgi:nucleoside-diphosphate-sugar epimerase
MKLEFENYLELSETRLKEHLAGCDGLIFASGVDERIDGPSPIYDFYKKYNITPLERILRTAKEAGVKSAVVCGSYFSHFDKIWPRMELSRWHPYIRCRRDQEAMALGFADENFSVAILELPYIFGTQPGREPVWTIIVKTIRSMPLLTMYPSGGTAMVTVRQVGEALAGAIERNRGGNCYPIGWWNKPWKEFLGLVHRYMGLPGRRVLTIPKWLFNLGIKGMEQKLRQPGAEGGINIVKFADLQYAETFVDKSLGCEILGVRDDGIEAAIAASIRLSVEVLDGKHPDIVKMLAV